ncbi:hypothetical protein K523DRAFT_124158 [Schizophyllum commune Tattone D]|nr:hypothetical protein K523DRAFT_124158 [Schizophyllum commune Tattone D]
MGRIIGPSFPAQSQAPSERHLHRTTQPKTALAAPTTRPFRKFAPRSAALCSLSPLLGLEG